jgi:hypothetical protein
MACQVTSIAVATEVTIIPGAGLDASNTTKVNNALYGLVISVSGTIAAGTVTIKDGTAGTTRMILDYPVVATAVGVPFVMFLPYDRPLFQAISQTNWTATCSAGSGTQTYHINAFYLEI